MDTEIKDRIQEIIKRNNINAAQFADSIGVQRSSISHILSGRNKPSLEFLEKLVLKYKDVNITWLLTGKTDISKNESQDLQLSFVNFNESKDKEMEVNETKTIITTKPRKQIEKIVTFYSDKTFTEYFPE